MSRSQSSPEIAEDRSFQEQFWKIERIFWGAFGLLILAAALGLFGSGGPFSRGATFVGESRINHPLTARWEAGDELSVRLAGSAGERSLTLSSDFAEAFEIEDMQPSPQRVEADGSGHRYVFTAMGDLPIEIRIALVPRHPGYVTYRLTPGSGQPVNLSTFVWP